jgi:hypothetical protein
MSWYKKAILDQNYGGFPSGGYYGSSMEYEIGAQRIGEAAHCIIGSCSSISNNDRGTVMGEIRHMEEEIGIIKRSLEIYGQPLYIGQFLQPDRWEPNEYNEKIYPTIALQSIEKSSQKLSALADQQMNAFTEHNDPNIFNIVKSTIELIQLLAKSMAKSVPAIKQVIDEWNIYSEQSPEEDKRKLSYIYAKEHNIELYKANGLRDPFLKFKAEEIDTHIKTYSEQVKHNDAEMSDNELV